ncbi:MAG TPA: hypothetical protein VFD47_07655 [Actinomycetota bacterium]|nr:hypothetical protein [Actinomycetota bacterium]
MKPARSNGDTPGPGGLDRLVWADSFIVDLDGFAYEFRATSVRLVRAAEKLVPLPSIDRRPAVVFSAVSRAVQPRRSPVLTLYQGYRPLVQTYSQEMLLKSYLSELRMRALGAATDRVYLKVPAVRVGTRGILLPSSALPRMVRLERAAERSRISLGHAADLVLDLKTGRPVHEFVTSAGPRNGRSIESLDVIAVERTSDGAIPSREDLLFELARLSPNLHMVGGEGLDALSSMVERARLIEWDEAHPDRTLKSLMEEPVH